MITLFSGRSISEYSPIFFIDEQVTIYASGMGADDYITFERVEIDAALMPKACGCVLIPATSVAIISTEPLLCPACLTLNTSGTPTQTAREVTLYASNPVIVLDHPQRSAIRAHYHGDLTTGEVLVVARETTTNTSPLAPSDIGCPPVTRWEPTDEVRCIMGFNGLVAQRRETDGCGNERWVNEPIVWVPTGRQRCLGKYVEVEETSQCGTRWTQTSLIALTPTGRYRCDDLLHYEEYRNDCGDLSWQALAPLTWTPTCETCCLGGFVNRQEVNQCGALRWVPTAETCGCTPNWVWDGQTDCSVAEGQDYLIHQVDGCGNERWVSGGGPVVWTATGRTRCTEGLVENEERNQCGDERWTTTAIDCGTCTPVWVNIPGSIRCTGANVEQEQSDGCGNTRWVDTGTPVTWTNTGNTRCNSVSLVIENEQINNCNGTRWTATATPCSPCDPGTNWTNTGNHRCQDGWYQAEQEDDCGQTRWVNVEPIVWTDVPGSEGCSNHYQTIQQSNQCGDTRTVAVTDHGDPVECDEQPLERPTVYKCCAAPGGTAQSQIQILQDKTGTFTTSCFGGGFGSPFDWLAYGNPENYEAKLDLVPSTGSPPTPTGSPVGTWVDLGAGPASWTFTLSGSGAQAVAFEAHVTIRVKANPSVSREYEFDISLGINGGECI